MLERPTLNILGLVGEIISPISGYPLSLFGSGLIFVGKQYHQPNWPNWKFGRGNGGVFSFRGYCEKQIAASPLIERKSRRSPRGLLDTDIIIDPGSERHRPTNLKVTSAIRLHKLATSHVSNLARLGNIDEVSLSNVRAKLRMFLNVEGDAQRNIAAHRMH